MEALNCRPSGSDIDRRLIFENGGVEGNRKEESQELEQQAREAAKRYADMLKIRHQIRRLERSRGIEPKKVGEVSD